MVRLSALAEIPVGHMYTLVWDFHPMDQIVKTPTEFKSAPVIITETQLGIFDAYRPLD